MISQEIQRAIIDCAREFGATALWLFGSSLDDDTHAHDIDLAVEGLTADQFFSFYRRLYFDLPKPVDLVDLSENPPLASIIREKGLRIYG